MCGCVKSTVLKARNIPQMDDGLTAEHAYAVRIKGAWEFLQSSSFNIYQNVNEKIKNITTVHVTIIDQEQRKCFEHQQSTASEINSEEKNYKLSSHSRCHFSRLISFKYLAKFYLSCFFFHSILAAIVTDEIGMLRWSNTVLACAFVKCNLGVHKDFKQQTRPQ